MKHTHVVIARPQPEAGELAERLADAGLIPVVMPAYRFTPAQPGAELSDFALVKGRRLLVFTSKRAVEFGLPSLPAALLGECDLAAIGPATAAALASCGYPVSVQPEDGFTSEHLLAHPDLALNPGSALILAAPGGRTALAEGLAARGWRVATAFVYQREDIPPAAEETAKLVAARSVISVWTSENAMRALAGSLPESAWQKICAGMAVVTSERLARALTALGAENVAVAPGPGNDDLYAQVLQLI